MTKIKCLGPIIFLKMDTINLILGLGSGKHKANA